MDLSRQQVHNYVTRGKLPAEQHPNPWIQNRYYYLIHRETVTKWLNGEIPKPTKGRPWGSKDSYKRTVMRRKKAEIPESSPETGSSTFNDVE